jgi:uncharacterized protein (DUF2249 family)
MPEHLPERMSKHTPERLPGNMLEILPEHTPDPMPQHMVIEYARNNARTKTNEPPEIYQRECQAS